MPKLICKSCRDVATYEVDGDYYCESHYMDKYTTCTDCDEEEILQEDSYYIKNHGDVCASCLDQNYSFCEAHEEYERDEILCSVGPIKRYGATPEDGWSYYRATRDASKLFIGFELEVENPNYDDDKLNTTAGTLQEAYPQLFMTQDASLANGFEIKTHPFTQRYYQDGNLDSLIKSLDKLRDDDYRSYHTNGRAGFHIHLSKAYFTKIEQIKLVTFISQYSAFFEKLGQRSLNAYCLKNDKPKKYGEDLSKGRRAVNIGGRTIELRFPKGNLLEARINKNIEMAFSLARFVKQYPLQKMTVESYLDFLHLNKKEYRHLLLFIKTTAAGKLNNKTNEERNLCVC